MEELPVTGARPGKAMLRHVKGDGDEFIAPIRETGAGDAPMLKVLELSTTPGLATGQSRTSNRGKSADFHRAFIREAIGLPCASLSQRAKGLILLNLVSVK